MPSAGSAAFGIRLVGRGRGTGIVGWSLRGLPSDGSLDDLDGVPTTRSDAAHCSRRPRTRTASPRSTTSCCCHPTWIGRSKSLAAVGVDPRRDATPGTGWTTDPPDLLPVRRGGNHRRGRRLTRGVERRGPWLRVEMAALVADIDAAASFFGNNATVGESGGWRQNHHAAACRIRNVGPDDRIDLGASMSRLSDIAAAGRRDRPPGSSDGRLHRKDPGSRPGDGVADPAPGPAAGGRCCASVSTSAKCAGASPARP